MKIQHLRFFIAVVDCGGVVRAAERLRMSQPSISAGLKALEEELGQPLFRRRGAGRSLRPTPKALRFYADAREILRHCDVARARFTNDEHRPSKLRIGVLQTIASYDVAAFSSALTLRDPNLRLQVWEGGAIRIGEWLRQARIDAAWTIVDKDASNARVLWREPFVVLSSRTHPFATGAHAKLSVADLEGQPFVLRLGCEAKRGQLWPEGTRIRVVARAERDELALRLVSQGLGIAIAPLSLAATDVVARSMAGLDATRSVGLRWRSDVPDDILATLLDASSTVGGQNISGCLPAYIRDFEPASTKL
jgi:DNA-binding transcriptional LysR family regulator